MGGKSNMQQLSLVHDSVTACSLRSNFLAYFSRQLDADATRKTYSQQDPGDL